MVRRWMTPVSVGVVLAIGAGSVAAEVIAYPKKGQTQEQFQQDQYQCHEWAKGQTGFGPMAPQPSTAAPPTQQGGAVKGAARGAALGAIGGAIAGDAGKHFALVIGVNVVGVGGVSRSYA